MILNLLQAPDRGISRCKGPGAGKRSGMLGRAEAEMHGKELPSYIWGKSRGFK